MTGKEMVTHVQSIDGKVIVTFPSPITFLNMPPDVADEFAELIRQAAAAARTRLAANESAPPPGTKPS